MHCEDRPIFDRYVAAFFGTRVPAPCVERAVRIRWFIEFLDQVRASYRQWAKDATVAQVLNRLRARDAGLADCDDVRLMDFLVWKAGKQNLLSSQRRATA